MRLLANRAGIRTYLVDYHLAPEAKWPAQLEENEFVVRWLFKNAVDQGVDPSKVLLLAPCITRVLEPFQASTHPGGSVGHSSAWLLGVSLWVCHGSAAGCYGDRRS